MPTLLVQATKVSNILITHGHGVKTRHHHTHTHMQLLMTTSGGALLSAIPTTYRSKSVGASGWSKPHWPSWSPDRWWAHPERPPWAERSVPKRHSRASPSATLDGEGQEKARRRPGERRDLGFHGRLPVQMDTSPNSNPELMKSPHQNCKLRCRDV